MIAFSSVSPTDLRCAIDRLKGNNIGHRPLTNYFFQPVDKATNLRMLESERTLCFSHDEWDFTRVYIVTFDVENLGELLQAVSWPPLVVTDWVCQAAPDIEICLMNLGFHLHATYDRIVCTNIRSDQPNTYIDFASPRDREHIHALLFRAFDKYADHIMLIEELDELITERLVILNRDPRGTIDGLVVFPLKGQSCHFNFLYNSGGSVGLSRLLGNFYGVLTERGVKAGFGWVRRTRPLVLRLHESFGWKKDGLVDRIYLRS